MPLRPPRHLTSERLARLCRLAELKRDCEMRRLSALAQTRARLRTMLEALREDEPLFAPEPASPRCTASENERAGQPSGAGGDKGAPVAPELTADTLRAGLEGRATPAIPETVSKESDVDVENGGHRTGFAQTSAQMAGEDATKPTAEGPAISPYLLRVRMAHAAWKERQRVQLRMQLARAEADFQRALPPAAQAFGRAKLLADLSRAAAQAEKRARLVKSEE